MNIIASLVLYIALVT